ncbi:MAG: Hsp20/alpha crystallin family protein [Desulfobacteraceae bacterium]|jgi:HSP20 family protein
MPELVIWKRQKLSKLRREMDRMLERVLGEFGAAPCPGITLKKPHYDLIETGTDLILNAEIPGMDPNDIEIDITDNVLTIAGEIRQDTVNEDTDHHRLERRFSTFSRSISIPKRIVVSRVKATYEKGVLKIIMPKYSGEEKRGVKVRLR